MHKRTEGTCSYTSLRVNLTLLRLGAAARHGGQSTVSWRRCGLWMPEL